MWLCSVVVVATSRLYYLFFFVCSFVGLFLIVSLMVAYFQKHFGEAHTATETHLEAQNRIRRRAGLMLSFYLITTMIPECGCARVPVVHVVALHTYPWSHVVVFSVCCCTCAPPVTTVRNLARPAVLAAAARCSRPLWLRRNRERSCHTPCLMSFSAYDADGVCARICGFALPVRPHTSVTWCVLCPGVWVREEHGCKIVCQSEVAVRGM